MQLAALQIPTGTESGASRTRPLLPLFVVDEADRRRGLEQLARVKQQLRAARGVNGRSSVDVSLPGAAPVDGDVHQALQDRYEMELAAHRETTLRLLDEKDRRIELLEARIEELERLIADRPHDGAS